MQVKITNTKTNEIQIVEADRIVGNKLISRSGMGESYTIYPTIYRLEEYFEEPVVEEQAEEITIND